MGQGYSGEKGQSLLGFHLSAGAPLDSSLAGYLLQVLC